MVAIASGRDPSEVEELKDKLASANSDREALIARLRDAQIQMQLLREQIFELQTAVIDKLSIFSGQKPIKTKSTDQVILDPTIEEWIPKKWLTLLFTSLINVINTDHDFLLWLVGEHDVWEVTDCSQWPFVILGIVFLSYSIYKRSLSVEHDIKTRVRKRPLIKVSGLFLFGEYKLLHSLAQKSADLKKPENEVGWT